MKLIIAIVSNEDSSLVMKELVKEKYFVTKLSSTGGFLKSGNTTLMIGAKDTDVDAIIKVISDYSKNKKRDGPKFNRKRIWLRFNNAYRSNCWRGDIVYY